jgi:molybdopterin converting factor small subunit
MSATLELCDLAPEPQDEWRRMLRFIGWSADDKAAASRSIAVLFQRGPELVAQTYDYLRQVPETAAILGWEQEVDEAHLEERRRFFTVWLARTLGLDSGDEFALYLFQAGKTHAGHGPRHIHTPAAYVTGSIGLVLAGFARCMAEAQLPAEVIAGAMAAWSKYLAVQLNQMLSGYQVARDLQKGALPIRCTVFGRLRPLIGAQDVQVHVESEASVGDVLRKFFNYYPQVRPEALDRVWDSQEKDDALWVEVAPAYVPRRGWRILLNGRDLSYDGGFATPVHAADEIAVFPPGR